MNTPVITPINRTFTEEKIGRFGNTHEEDILVKPLGVNLYLVDGSAAIRYINRRFGLSLSEEHVNTLAGFLLNSLGSIPEVGAHCEVDGVLFTVREVEDRRIEQIEVQLPEHKDQKEP